MDVAEIDFKEQERLINTELLTLENYFTNIHKIDT
jgi:hypothetical protein